MSPPVRWLPSSRQKNRNSAREIVSGGRPCLGTNAQYHVDIVFQLCVSFSFFVSRIACVVPSGNSFREFCQQVKHIEINPFVNRLRGLRPIMFFIMRKRVLVIHTNSDSQVMFYLFTRFLFLHHRWARAGGSLSRIVASAPFPNDAYGNVFEVVDITISNNKEGRQKVRLVSQRHVVARATFALFAWLGGPMQIGHTPCRNAVTADKKTTTDTTDEQHHSGSV